MQNSNRCTHLSLLNLKKFAGCLYKEVLDRATIGILVTDRQGDIKYLNQAYAEMFDMDIEVACTRNINDYFQNSKLMEVMRTGAPTGLCVFPTRGGRPW